MNRIVVAISTLVVLAGLVVGGWQLGWWLNEETVNRQARINNDSYARQSALVEDVLDKERTARDIDVQLTYATPEQQAALRAQRRAVVAQFCDSYGQINGRVTVPVNAEDFAQEEC